MFLNLSKLRYVENKIRFHENCIKLLHVAQYKKPKRQKFVSISKNNTQKVPVFEKVNNMQKRVKKKSNKSYNFYQNLYM